MWYAHGLYLCRLVLIAQAIFLFEHEQANTQAQRRIWTLYTCHISYVSDQRVAVNGEVYFCVSQVLHDFPHATSNIRPEYLFDMIGPLRPRAFSIASSQKVCVCVFSFCRYTRHTMMHCNVHLHTFQSWHVAILLCRTKPKWKTNRKKELKKTTCMQLSFRLLGFDGHNCTVFWLNAAVHL